MSDEQEQLDADQSLREAIERSRRVYGGDSGDALLTDFIVLFAEQGFTDDGASFTRYAYLTGSAMPLYRAVGLIQVVGDAIRNDDGA